MWPIQLATGWSAMCLICILVLIIDTRRILVELLKK